jgi:hypothetical protein
MNFLSWLGNLILNVENAIANWENPVINGIVWLEGLFGNVGKDLTSAGQIVTIVDENLATISTAIIEEAGTIEAILSTLKNINPTNEAEAISQIQSEAEKMYTVWVAQRNSILTAIKNISNQITVIEKTSL